MRKHDGTHTPTPLESPGDANLGVKTRYPNAAFPENATYIEIEELVDKFCNSELGKKLITNPHLPSMYSSQGVGTKRCLVMNYFLLIVNILREVGLYHSEEVLDQFSPTQMDQA